MKQYLDLAQRIVDKGHWVENERTGKKCLTVINADLTYNVGGGEFPLCTTRKSYWKAAVAELLGYIRGYDNAEDFRKLGTPTWNANANENPVWLNNPFNKGVDDMGRVYGVQGRRLSDVKLLRASEYNDDKSEYMEHLGYKEFGDTGGDCNTQFDDYDIVWKREIDQLRKVYDHLKAGVDDRGEIINFHNPADVEFGCLRSCMFMHHFSILNGKLYLNSTQRSCDVPLGLNFNMVQVYVFLAIMAQITGLEAGEAYHKIINAHIYEDQLDIMKNEQLGREPLKLPKFKINPAIKTLEDLETWVTLDDFEVEGYECHPPIKYPFTV
ncbi:thymidylate synthase [Vibrio phage 3.058.O._10N.286.46.B8]|nr:thymidylate synthase [Vibrio phage 2.058.O._10N.286.46.B8]AUS03152.1 thymidylate synthase [Vibrio phage 3.058.O._10N.286.46.B8]